MLAGTHVTPQTPVIYLTLMHHRITHSATLYGIRLDKSALKNREMQMKHIHALLLSFMVCTTMLIGSAASAATAENLTRDSNQALATLIQTNPLAAQMSRKAKAVLIFPNIVKAGLVFGGAYGQGVLKQNSKVSSYYNSVTASFGWQAGAESYGYVVFLMTKNAVQYIRDTQGWEIGIGPSVVIVNDGIAKNLSTSTLKDGAYAFIFDQQGLMASLSIEGTKITKINRP